MGRRDRAAVQAPRQADMVAVMDALRRVVRALRVSTRAAERRFGISGAQLFVLEKLVEAPAPSVDHLAARTLTDQSSVSMVVSRLVAADLVRRTPSRGDARRVSISLTPSGRALVRKAPHTAQTRLIAGLQTFSRSELRQLGDYLEAVSELAGEPVEGESRGE